MKTILIGNGLNIKCRPDEYTNKAIMDRLLNNICNRDYSNILPHVTSDELKELYEGLGDKIHRLSLKGNYDCWAISAAEKTELKNYKSYYSINDSLDQIGMEYYFLLMRLFNNSFSDAEKINKDGAEGMQYLFIDAIYNDSKIQLLTQEGNLPNDDREILRKAINSYDNIFTVNYDNNIENLTDKRVYKLHGSFDYLFSQYKQGTKLNSLCTILGKQTTFDERLSHMHCNAIMGFSGEEKLRKMNTCNKIDKMYPIQEFLEMEGELHIVGMSPNNDSHIWSLIERSDIHKIIYYARENWQEKYIKIHHTDLNIEVKYIDDKWEYLLE